MCLTCVAAGDPTGGSMACGVGASASVGGAGSAAWQVGKWLGVAVAVAALIVLLAMPWL